MATESVFVSIDSPKDSISNEPSRATATSDVPTFTLEWLRLTLRVPQQSKTPASDGVQSDERVILKDVSGFAKPGELLVVMGPSGAGKTSLLNCISGRNSLGLGADSTITVNGHKLTRKMKHLTTYVMQDDLFYETLTVREHLVFQARLRLGGAFSREQCDHRVNRVLRDYGLGKIRDALIGGMRVRGISGGEKKRLSIASEVLGSASIFFVDEPTSGLDSFMAAAVVTQLKQIACQGKTVIATIHQPSSELFAMFDKLYLLAAGEVVYHGPATDAVKYFAPLGHQCPNFLNPADYFMTQLAVSDKDEAPDPVDSQRLQSLIQAWSDYSRSEAYTSTLPQLKDSPSDQNDASSVVSAALSPAESTNLGAVGQVVALAQRNVVRLVRDKLSFRVAILQSVMTAVIVGLVYLQLDVTQSGVQNFAGVFFFFTVSQTMITANGQFSAVPTELVLIEREYKAGLYHVASWFVAKNVSELPLQVLLPIIFYVPVYFLVGIGHGFAVYFYQQVLLVVLNSTAVGFGYMVSCLSRRADITPVIGIVLLMPMLLLGGLLINSDDIPVYLVWIEYISPLKYGYEGLMKVFWERIDTIPCDAAVGACSALSGAQVLQNFSMLSRSALDSGLLLVALNVGFRLVGFASLLVALKRDH